MVIVWIFYDLINLKKTTDVIPFYLKKFTIETFASEYFFSIEINREVQKVIKINNILLWSFFVFGFKNII